MKSNESLENMLRKLRYRRAGERREKSLANVIAAFDESQGKTPPTKRREIGRIIMTSKLARLAAAAAIVVTAVFLWRVSVATNKAYALSDVPGLFSRARTIHICTRRFSGGQELLAEHWVDLENGRLYRYWEALASAEGPDGLETVKHITETVADEAFVMRVDHTSKTVEFEKRLASQEGPRRAIMAERAATGTLEDIEHFDQYRLVDHGQIDGRRYDVWRREFRIGTSGSRIRYEYWISPETGAVGRLRQSVRNQADRNWELISETEKIEIDKMPPAGIFLKEPPAGYAVKNDKAAAEIAGLDLDGFQSMGEYALRVPASFTLEDGSILACWRGLHDSVGAGPDSLYEGLIFGGDLPRAPAELVAMMTRQDEDHPGVPIHYVGRHVTTTRKTGRVYEWALYVPQQVVPVEGICSYNLALIRLNMAPSVNPVGGRTWVVTSFAVTARSFAEYVRPAARELSDSAAVPSEITYDRLLALAEEVRKQPDLYTASQRATLDAREHIGVLEPVDPSEVNTPEQVSREARRLVEAFYAAIVEGRDGDAGRMLMYEEPRASRVVTWMSELPGVRDIAPEDVYATEEAALVVTSEFAGPEGRRGRWAIGVRREKGIWLIKDFDATTTDTMQAEINKYLQQFPEAKYFSGR